MAKTTIEIPDELFRATKSEAARRGETLKTYVCVALEERLYREKGVREVPGWRRVFGRARADEVREIDAIVAEEFGRVDPDDWK
ncbi:MAG: hypothetical protein DWQ36_00925 [Acidobacteria bacterium]|nr:MAG: hypothetical protein DWQ30_08910 [Acidobacteriota bacterium]REK11820.1 MAG: hypothetical protein DWQ36_00925 [Acidobacteriota bacterium]